MRTLAIIGVPASGKTTLACELIRELVHVPIRRLPVGFLPIHRFGLLRYHEIRPEIVILGVYHGTMFQGTDRLSMGVQNDAVRFMLQRKYRSIIVEGDRLANEKFFSIANRLGELKVVKLSPPQDEIERRLKARNREVDEVWLKGRRTKVRNLTHKFVDNIDFSWTLDSLVKFVADR